MLCTSLIAYALLFSTHASSTCSQWSDSGGSLIDTHQSLSPAEQAARGIFKASGIKLAVAKYLLSQGTPPLNNSQAGVARCISSTFVESVNVLAPDGRIQITFGGKADQSIHGISALIIPTLANNAVQFTCISEDNLDTIKQACLLSYRGYNP